MPADFPTRNKAIIVNDEANDSQGQLATGEEAVDGDGNVVVSVTRSAATPLVTDVRPAGQLWLCTTDTTLWWSRGAGTWQQVPNSGGGFPQTLASPQITGALVDIDTATFVIDCDTNPPEFVIP